MVLRPASRRNQLLALMTVENNGLKVEGTMPAVSSVRTRIRLVVLRIKIVQLSIAFAPGVCRELHSIRRTRKGD